MSAVTGATAFYQFLEEIDLPCFRLVAHGHEHERRVVAVSVEDAVELRLAPGQTASRVEVHRVLAVGQFRLEIDAEFVCCVKGGLRRHPGMGAEVINAKTYSIVTEQYEKNGIDFSQHFKIPEGAWQKEGIVPAQINHQGNRSEVQVQYLFEDNFVCTVCFES